MCFEFNIQSVVYLCNCSVTFNNLVLRYDWPDYNLETPANKSTSKSKIYLFCWYKQFGKWCQQTSGEFTHWHGLKQLEMKSSLFTSGFHKRVGLLQRLLNILVVLNWFWITWYFMRKHRKFEIVCFIAHQIYKNVGFWSRLICSLFCVLNSLRPSDAYMHQ